MVEAIKKFKQRIDEKIDAPIGRFYQRHFQQVKDSAASLSENEINKRISRYKIIEPTSTFVISALATIDGVLGLAAVNHFAGPDVTIIATPIVALAAGIIGPHRGIVRDSERRIYEKELTKRQTGVREIVFSAKR